MKFDSPLFDGIRVKPSKDRRPKTAGPGCEWHGCTEKGTHRAPKGRNRENEHWRFCLAHVRQYNQSYNFFAGMNDSAVMAYQKDALTGHRPTWKLGRNGSANVTGMRRRAINMSQDPFGLNGAAAKEPGRHPTGRALRSTELKALQTLGLDDHATPEQVKTQYKTLVKRLHPDANAGSRANEDTLKSVIQAYDHLRSSGFC